MAAGAVDFPLFSRLPAELRVQIWEETLPKFMKSQGVNAHITAKKSIVFRRPFNPKVDTLFVSEDQFRDFLWEPVNVILSNRGLEDVGISCTEPAPMCLAVSCLIGETEDSFLSELFQHVSHRNTQKLVLINNAGILSNKRRASQQHWELSSALSTPKFVWNNAGDHFEGSEEISDSDWKLLRGLNRSAADGMTDGLGWDKDHRLEVYLATAVKMRLQVISNS
ncbi:hypothetical protein CBS147343_3366 [Aspergillus niger]|nr:hypothetical protein CBS133816_3573 [Aspergillus niger]KAI2837584.1 hypothetical protein CBS11350_8624 [Aspergillus niger]KAI2847482.1 hypothetical protein CBS12448_9333 [Aspergillus niger]KAI2948458.1 hypothetical protein CBS147321_2518 [Aspergillus niger]KAI2968420.1 hypothetical protein CBS147324_6519 [Aspergillus niger]